MKKRVFFLAAFLLALTQGAMAWEGDGTASNPYLIQTVDDWNHIHTIVKESPDKEVWANAFFLQTDDLDISQGIGCTGEANDKTFCGNYDGGGHTLNCTLSNPDRNSPEAVAPFHRIGNATIQNLHVTGYISGGIHSAGLVAYCSTGDGQTASIRNCRVSAEISCRGSANNDAHGGGIVGHCESSSLTVANCLFDGYLVALTNSKGDIRLGAIVGWGDSPDGVTLTGCVENGLYNRKSDDGQTAFAWFYHPAGSTDYPASLSDCAYAGDLAYNSGAEMIWSVTSGEDRLKLVFGETVRNGSEGGAGACWASLSGLRFINGTCFAPAGTKVQFGVKYPEGRQISEIRANGKPLDPDTDGRYCFTQETSPTVITALFAWQGDGSKSEPYIISCSSDWRRLAEEVKGGNTFEGKYFQMTANINAMGISVGDETHAFSGIFDGYSHTITYNRGGNKPDRFETVDDFCAPFVLVDGATIRHLNVTGDIFCSHKYAASIVSMIDGDKATNIMDCSSDCLLRADNNLRDDATFGGIVGVVKESCTASPTLKDCTFTGDITGLCTRSAGMVGYTGKLPVNFDHCMFDPKATASTDGCATFVRTAPGTECSFKECYYTIVWGEAQGEAVFRDIIVPDNCVGKIVSESTVKFNGEEYWQSGAVIELTAPDDVPFYLWATNTGGCWISDPWQRSGQQIVRDINHIPSFGIETSMPEPREGLREMDGTLYRYLYREDYHYYLSDELCREKGYHFDDKGELFKWSEKGDHIWVTAVVGWKDGKIPSDGAQIHNDLSGDLKDYTLTACIAPHAFEGCNELKTLYFKDTDATHYNEQTPFDFIIGPRAFANCPNLTEIKMMQYTTRGSNHWEALRPDQVSYVADNVFEDSPNAMFSCDASVYQDYMGSTTWKEQRNRIIVYNHTFKSEDFEVNGAKYNHFFTTAGDPIKNDSIGHAALMQQLRLWNGDYQQFNAATLLSNSSENIWYTQVLDADNGYLKSHGGVMRIYNDPGSYYNYKTIAIRSLGQSKEVKSIEFWQTNGRSSNSFSEPKMVIMNNAFAGCDSLKELRLFYYVEDGDDRWMALGPQDVIPGDNIFGLKEYTEEELKQMMDGTYTASDTAPKVPKGFKILVSPELYPQFLDDPNWIPYIGYIEPMDYSPSVKKDISRHGLTYGFMTNPGGILQTSQTVSQDVSWGWTAARIAIEVALIVATVGFSSGLTSAETAMTTAYDAAIAAATDEAECKTLIEMCNVTSSLLSEGVVNPAYVSNLYISAANQGFAKQIFTSLPNFLQESFIEAGWMTEHSLYYQEFSRGITTLCENMSTELLEAMVNSLHGAASHTLTASYGLQSVAQTAMGNYYAALQTYANTVFKSQIAKGLASTAVGTSTAGIIASSCWGGSGTYNGDQMQKGMRANILSNIHQVGLVGGGYVITTPNKNIVYHTYVKDVPKETKDAVIYAGFDDDGNNSTSDRTMTFAKKAFRDHKELKTVSFHSMEDQSSNAGLPMLLTIPDSAFVGCDNLVEFNLLLQDNEGGTRPLGPENFILAGDSIFAGLDSTKFHIVIDPSRKQDFLDSESWAPLQRFFTYREAMPKAQYNVYGGQYAFSYENNSILREEKVMGHLIQHTEVIGADDKFLEEHQGALKLCNDIGEWSNYQLDAVHRKAFMGNENLRVVYFTDLYGAGAYGTSYTSLEMALGDSCFANCTNLANLDLLYLVTDGTNHIDPISPQQVKIGTGVFHGTEACIKMMPEQVPWFEADSAWATYKDRFMPCIIHPADDGIKKALKDMAYYDMAHTGNDWKLWDDYIDLARIAGAGFSWLDGKFTKYCSDIRSFPDFQHFESVGLSYVGKEWFKACYVMSDIVLPKTIRVIRERAFALCENLPEIELPDGVMSIEDYAFEDCRTLKTIVVRSAIPAHLGAGAFPKNVGMKIYVPAENLDNYLSAWAEYKDYIVKDSEYKINKVVEVKNAGKLADELDLYVEWSYSGPYAGDEPRYIHGNFSKYDSLTVSGPLNDLDLWVIRYLAGNNGYNRGGVATDGRLQYLNLYGASIVKDSLCNAHYLNSSVFINNLWREVDKDNALPIQLFHGCTALESVILPKTLTTIASGIFEGCTALKSLAVTGALNEYDGYGFKLYHMLDYPLEELVFLTDGHAASDAKDPWGQQIGVVYTTQDKLSNYLNDPCLINQTENVIAPFEDNAVWDQLVEHGEFFPSVFMEKEDVGDIFSEQNKSKKLKTFDEFQFFNKVKSLDQTFAFDELLKRVSIPASVEHISADAFHNCFSLDTLTIKCDSVPELEGDPFKHLPSDYVILVPRDVVKAYRTKWPQYAEHINPEATPGGSDEILTVTLNVPNTLADKLGLTPTWSGGIGTGRPYELKEIRGDYSKIKRLKVIGPISGGDLELIRYLAGFCPWSNTRNFSGHLEYVDLYEAQLKATDYDVAPDVITTRTTKVDEENVLPAYSFLQCYNLRTLILPKTCKEVRSRALQQCEALEALVLGDDMEEFNWDALDDDASLTRMYILADRKVDISSEFAVWRWLCNNYNPTFDAFYVRPSQYDDYIYDTNYTGSSWQRTNNISTGAFTDDDSFKAFASHATATSDDLSTVYSVKGWFDAHPGAKDLTPLMYTSIDSLSKATLAPLTRLEKISMPITLTGMEAGLFDNAKDLRYVDFVMCDSTEIVSGLHGDGLKRLGIDNQRTLVYVPSTYGESDGTNVVAFTGKEFHAKTFRMIDSLNYLVPYAFETDSVANSRPLSTSAIPYTFCVPYKLKVPGYARAYQLSDRDGSTLVFKEVTGELEAMVPYLLKVVGNKRLRVNSTTLNTNIAQTIPANGGNTYGKQVNGSGYAMRGTFEGIDNKTASELGAYILQSDGDWHPVASSTDAEKKAEILPYRAFLIPSTKNAQSRIGMTLEDATDIDSIETIDEDGTRRYYDLQGRELPSKPTRGIYIQGGKKLLVE